MSGKNRILKNLYKQAGRAYFSVYVSLYETKKNAKIPYKSIIYGGEDVRQEFSIPLAISTI
jgi:hypothetical protein